SYLLYYIVQISVGSLVVVTHAYLKVRDAPRLRYLDEHKFTHTWEMLMVIYCTAETTGAAKSTFLLDGCCIQDSANP
ncbi:hypothetical protein CpipJ_CPIJ015552, partial [Culex quinquefasciatus]